MYIYNVLTLTVYVLTCLVCVYVHMCMRRSTVYRPTVVNLSSIICVHGNVGSWTSIM